MSLANRKEGLVQRRNVVQQSMTRNEDVNSDEEKRVREEEDQDSKQTRLTLMEEVLLLGLKDREVYIGYSTKIMHIC